MKYVLNASASKSKIVLAYARLCAQGKLGESLILEGVNVNSFAKFAVRMLEKAHALPEADRVALFNSLALGNSSQARQAIGELTIEVEGKKPQSVSDLWLKSGPVVSSTAVDSLLDSLEE